MTSIPMCSTVPIEASTALSDEPHAIADDGLQLSTLFVENGAESARNCQIPTPASSRSAEKRFDGEASISTSCNRPSSVTTPRKLPDRRPNSSRSLASSVVANYQRTSSGRTSPVDVRATIAAVHQRFSTKDHSGVLGVAAAGDGRRTPGPRGRLMVASVLTASCGGSAPRSGCNRSSPPSSFTQPRLLMRNTRSRAWSHGTSRRSTVTDSFDRRDRRR